MKIGLDLDNTLVNYELSFIAAAESLQLGLLSSVRSKSQIREFLRAKPNGEHVWQRLQGLAYGRFAKNHAKLYSGVKRFLWRCKQHGHSVTVVSHKTEYGHHDNEKASLRQIASDFLKAQNLLDSENGLIQRVVYTSTREEKVDCITNERFDWFVDDLPEVVYALEDIPGLKTIHFDPMLGFNCSTAERKNPLMSLSDWQQIDALINGEWNAQELTEIANKLIQPEVIEVNKLSAGGNAGVFRVMLEDHSAVRLKVYPTDSNHDRLHSEFAASTALFRLKQGYASKPLAKDEGLGVGIYEWIDGDRVALPTKQDMASSLEFLARLHDARTSPLFLGIGPASAACLCGGDIEVQIEKRLQQFELPRMRHAELDRFLSGAFQPTSSKLLERAREEWPDAPGFDTPLDRSQQTLSPSDFGFHNAIRRPDGSLAFIDFEYFGWDDPVKLMSDFVLHQGMTLSDEQKLLWLEGALDIYGATCSARLAASAPLYGLIWCLIILNDFRPEIWQRRSLADASKQNIRPEILARQLERANALLNKVSTSRSCLFAEIRHL